MMKTTKKATILGITGNYGRALAAALSRRGYALRALVRDLDRGRATTDALGFDVELLPGDALDPDAVARAAAGADVIAHGLNPPYHQWANTVVRLAENVAAAAAAEGATLLFPGNVYAYAPGIDIGEEHPTEPPRDKGRIRIEAERVLHEATNHGARLILLRGGDFFGQGGASSWSAELLRRAVTGGPLAYPGPLDVRHQWAYLPDFARAHVDLLERAHALPAAAVFHFEGHVATGHQWIAAAREALRDPARPAKTVPWWLLRLASPFSPMLRELLKMRYLWEEEVVMTGDRLRQTLGDVPCTPLARAIGAELDALVQAAGAAPTAEGAALATVGPDGVP